LLLPTIASLIETAKLHGIDSKPYLADNAGIRLRKFCIVRLWASHPPYIGGERNIPKW